MSLIKSILIEKRARLCACNFYIKLYFDCDEIDLTINSKSIKFAMVDKDLNNKVEQFDIPFEIDVKTLANFTTTATTSNDEHFMSFRVLFKSKSHNFRANIIQNDATNCPMSVKSRNFFDINQKSFTSNEIRLQCATCLNYLTKPVIFKRVLPLPSDFISVDDWFCHKSSAHDQMPFEVCQKIDDLLYNHCDVSVAKSIVLSESLLTCEATYRCRRCVAWLGTCAAHTRMRKTTLTSASCNHMKIHDDTDDTHTDKPKSSSVDKKLENFVKFSTCSLVFTLKDKSKLQPPSPLNAFLTLVTQLVAESGIVCKILLECRESANFQSFLLIWVLDKSLSVLRYNEREGVTEKCLKEGSLTKLVFKYEEKSSDSGVKEVASQSLHCKWLDEVYVQYVPIASTMMQEGLKYLKSNASLFNFETSMNEFLVSCIL